MPRVAARIPLSPVDYTFLGESAYPIEFVFKFRTGLDPSRLRESLDRVLSSFTPARSVLRAAGTDALVFEESENGCVFEVRSRDDEADLGGPDAYGLLDSVRTVPGEPLTRARLTQTPGASYLGVSLSHAVADGYGYFYFLSSWAAAARGEEFQEPVLDRSLLAVPPADGPEDADSVRAESGWSLAEPRKAPRREHLRWTRLSLAREEVRALTREASSASDVRLSVNDVLAARLWKETSARWGGKGPRRFLSCPLDYRRLHPALDGRYFGNAVRGLTLSLDAGALEGSSLTEVAAAVHRAVAAADAGAALRSLACLEGLRRRLGLAGMERLHVCDPDGGLLVTNLSRVPLSRLDFGVGAPERLRILTPAPRAAAVLPDSAGGLDVHVCEPIY